MKRSLFQKLFPVALSISLALAASACGQQESPASGPAARENNTGKNRAEVYSYDLSGQDIIVDGLLFQEDVTITGELGSISFSNCTFDGSIVHKGGEGARVRLLEGCTVADSSSCILDSPLGEGTLETDLPKFMIFCPMPAVSCEKLGSVITQADQPIRLNGETCPIETADLFVNESTGESAPYSGQTSIAHNLARYLEDGELKTIHVAVFAEE